MAEGKVQLEIQYCVPCGFFWQAVGVAEQVVAGRNREIGVTLTPAGQGRFTVLLDGDVVYDRTSPPDGEVKDPVGDVRGSVSVAELIRTKVLTRLQTLEAQQPIAVGAGH
ncbi:MAG: Rdx family protein [Chloroflexi bacterium]|nr:Rdx family protein [Chloroflexota bacterium]